MLCHSDSSQGRLSQFSASVPLECHSDHSSANGTKFMANHATDLPICPSTINLATAEPLEPLGCHSTIALIHGIQSL